MALITMQERQIVLPVLELKSFEYGFRDLTAISHCLSDFMVCAKSDKLCIYGTTYFTNPFFKIIVFKGMGCNEYSQTQRVL